ncbi:DNA-packaging protein [Chengkuizengella sp. SCS-71B]|uniref:DNA-packaging protein n=1 Tax=Chengkuizengella sp. SCS-71B TaxID=3115290 RepID=UPI0032C22B84
MAIERSDILELVKSRLQILETNHDELILSYVEEIELRMLHYCNLTAIPDGLKFTWVKMTIDALHLNKVAIPEIEALEEFETKIGDTTVKSVGVKGVDTVVKNYRIDLNRYRKLRW